MHRFIIAILLIPMIVLGQVGGYGITGGVSSESVISDTGRFSVVTADSADFDEITIGTWNFVGSDTIGPLVIDAGDTQHVYIGNSAYLDSCVDFRRLNGSVTAPGGFYGTGGSMFLMGCANADDYGNGYIILPTYHSATAAYLGATMMRKGSLVGVSGGAKISSFSVPGNMYLITRYCYAGAVGTGATWTRIDTLSFEITQDDTLVAWKTIAADVDTFPAGTVIQGELRKTGTYSADRLNMVWEIRWRE